MVAQKTKLPPELKKWVKEYEKVGERNKFIWGWLYQMFQIMQLPGVSKKYQRFLWQIKVLLTMFIVQIDDIADKKQSKILLDEILKIPLNQKLIKFNRLNQTEKEYLKFTIKIWNYIKKTIEKYPQYKKLNEVFNYDIDQVLNTMKYSCLINKNPYLINKTEFWIYLPHNMMAMVCCTIDLMCSSKLKIQELGKIRKIFWCAQKMARIGNWVSTWEREIKERDFTSGVFVYATDSKIISVEEIFQSDESKIIKKIKNSKVERELLKEWEQCYFEIKKLDKEIKIFDVKEFLSGLERFIGFHLISRGYK